jgi:hypothetical protein
VRYHHLCSRPLPTAGAHPFLCYPSLVDYSKSIPTLPSRGNKIPEFQYTNVLSTYYMYFYHIISLFIVRLCYKQRPPVVSLSPCACKLTPINFHHRRPFSTSWPAKRMNRLELEDSRPSLDHVPKSNYWRPHSTRCQSTD